MDARYLRRKNRRFALAAVFAAVAAVVLWLAVDSWAESNKQRAIATFAPVVGTVSETDGESGRIFAYYEYRGTTAEQAFHVGSAGNYEPGGPVKLLVNPRNPSEAYLRTEKYDFLPGPLPMLEPILGPGAVIAMLAALWVVWDCRRKSRVLAQYPIRTMTVRKPLGSKAVVPDSEPGFAYDVSGVPDGSVGVAGPMSPKGRTRSVFVSPKGNLKWAKGPYPAARDEARRPSAEQIREIAAVAGLSLVNRNAPLPAQPVLLVQRHGGLIWLPDGSIAGAVKEESKGTGKAATHIGDVRIVTIVDRHEQVVVSLEAPYQALEGRGPVSVKDGAGQEIGRIEEQGHFDRKIYLAVDAPVAEYRRRSGATITDNAGRVMAEITQHSVAVPGRRRPVSVLLVTLAPTDGPLRTMVFANAVTAYTTVVPTWGGGGG
jgi:hypothetical protein